MFRGRPPGTGKSYVGVVMTRAMLIVRKLWMMTNPSVGRPPILVLSYKVGRVALTCINADVFLCRIMRSMSSCAIW